MKDLYHDSSNYVGEINPSNGTSFGVIKIGTSGKQSISFPVVIANYSLRKSEKIQISESFNEFVHINAFGKSADVLNLTGHVFSTRTKNSLMENIDTLLIDKYNNDMRAYKCAQTGNLVTVSGPGNMVFFGVVVDMSIVANAQMNNMFDFTMNLVSADSTLAYTGSIESDPGSAQSGSSDNTESGQQIQGGSSPGPNIGIESTGGVGSGGDSSASDTVYLAIKSSSG